MDTPTVSDKAPPVLEVEGLKTIFHTQDGTIHAVNGVSLHLRAGELVGVVGESGSGKSVTMMSLMKLLPEPPAEIVSGTVRLEGRDLLRLGPGDLRKVRGAEVGFIFQCPFAARCAHVHDRCHAENPPLVAVSEGHDVACWWRPDQVTSGRRHDG